MITAILPAAGNGSRAGFAENKVLRELNGLPVLAHTLSAFAGVNGIGEILVVCREQDEQTIKTLLRPFPLARAVRGGATRFESVYNALKEAKGEIVLVHDGARPFVTGKIIADCIASVKTNGSGICAVPVTDTVAIAENGRMVAATERKNTYAVQTPQGFYREKLLAAYERARAEHTETSFTDDGGVYARYVEAPALFAGAPENRKLTFAEDFYPAARVGFGVDTHAFYAEDEGAPFINFVTLGGVRIPSDKILKAHSDGDVLVHALMDALLSAAGLRDIGYYFPDTDAAYAGADSMELLARVMELVKAEGFAPQNASISVLAETPRLSPYIEAIRRSLSQALGLSGSAVGIAAGTNEKLGYIGEGKGITVYATVLLRTLIEKE